MDEISKDSKIIYTFRFGTSEKIIHLTQQQLDNFPYLAALVSHADDFSSAKNDNDEYVLNYPICYNWFMAIFLSIIREQPSALFTELSQEENALNMLQLYDYLCINPLPLPLLNDEKLAPSNLNTGNGDKRINYRRANLSEARNIAIQFIIAIYKNEYNLDDFKLINSIFSLIMVILSNPQIFHSRFRHHTLTVVKKCCFWLFSKRQQGQLPTIQQIAKDNKIDSWIYLYDDDQPLPQNFNNAFAWKGIYVSNDKYDADFSPKYRFWESLGETGAGKSSLLDVLLGSMRREPLPVLKPYRLHCSNFFPSINESDHSHSIVLLDTPGLIGLDHENDIFSMDEFKQQQRKNEEAQSARSRRFNTLPKRPKIDRFKHRREPKAQKYR